MREREKRNRDGEKKEGKEKWHKLKNAHRKSTDMK